MLDCVWQNAFWVSFSSQRLHIPDDGSFNDAFKKCSSFERSGRQLIFYLLEICTRVRFLFFLKGSSDWSLRWKQEITELSFEMRTAPLKKKRKKRKSTNDLSTEANLLHTQRDRSIIPGHVMSLEQQFLYIFIWLQKASATQPYCLCSLLHCSQPKSKLSQLNKLSLADRDE